MKKSYIRRFCVISYIFFILLNGFMLYFLGNYFNLIFLVAMVIIPIATYFFCLFLSHYVKLSVSGASFVEKRSDEFVFNIELNNPTFLFTNNCILFVNVDNSLFAETTTHSLNIPINPFCTTAVSYPVKSEHCGVININISEIVIYDLLGIFSFRKNVSISKEIPVFPDYSCIDDSFTMDFSEGYSELEESTTKGNDSSEVSDVREYIPGDKLQNIHWKLSAKKDLLMVKEHISLTSSQLMFYVELAKLEDDLLDSILDYAYGIGYKLCNENIPFTFIWYSIRKKECVCKAILNNTQLKDAIFQMLYEIPIENYEEIRENIGRITGHEKYIIIGADYVLEKEKE